jgi:IS5 family transposase
MKTLAVVTLALALAVPALAQQYKWVDQDGKVRYGDLPPAGVKATPLKAPTAPAAAPASAAAGKAAEKPLSPEEAFQKRRKDQAEAEQKAEKERAEADAKRGNCDSARVNLRQLESGQRLSTTDAKGERAYMDDAQRAREIERARKMVSDWCG